MGTSYSLPTFEFMMQYSIENDDLPQPAHRFILNGAKPPRNFFRIYPSRDSMSIQTGQLTFEYYKSGNFHVEKMLVCYIFVFVSFMSLSMLTKLNTLKHIKAATPCFSSFAQNAMLLQLHHADWHTCQFQIAEQACTCKDSADLQQRFELPSALTHHFSNCFGRYGRRLRSSGIQKITMQVSHFPIYTWW